MGKIFCRNCRQANSSFEHSCSKCGLNLAQKVKSVPSRNPFNAEDDPYKTIAVREQEIKKISVSSKPVKPSKQKSNSKLYWIMGGAGVLALFSGFFVIVMIAGIYFYSSSNVAKAEELPKTPNAEEREDEDSGETYTEVTNAGISKHINKKLKRVGKYRLAKTGSPKIKFFKGSSAEQFALYAPRKRGKKSYVLFAMATYSSERDVKDFIAEKKAEIEREGGEVVSHEEKSTSDILVFREKDSGGQIIDCSKGVCVSVYGTKSDHTADFYKAYFK